MHLGLSISSQSPADLSSFHFHSKRSGKAHIRANPFLRSYPSVWLGSPLVALSGKRKASCNRVALPNLAVGSWRWCKSYVAKPQQRCWGRVLVCFPVPATLRTRPELVSRFVRSRHSALPLQRRKGGGAGGGGEKATFSPPPGPLQRRRRGKGEATDIHSTTMRLPQEMGEGEKRRVGGEEGVGGRRGGRKEGGRREGEEEGGGKGRGGR